MISSFESGADDPSGCERAREVELVDLATTIRFAGALARYARPGDVFALWGPLGVGKTAFARGFIGALGGTEEVPSPTFTLVQTYELGGLSVYHFDLYRLERFTDAYELDIEDAFSEGVSLIEWPERLGPLLPSERLDLMLSFGDTAGERRAHLIAHGAWAARLEEVLP